MKKRFIILLSALLVVLLCTTGVFAIESTVAPIVNLGSYLNFSQVSSGQIFLKVNPDGVAPVVGDYYHIFNNVYIKCTAVSSTRASFVPAISDDGSTFTDYSGLMQNDTTSTGYYMQFSFNSNGTLYVRGTYSSNIASTVLLSNVNPVISFGTSIIWDEPSASVGEVVDVTIPSGYSLVIEGACEILERNLSISNSWNFSNSDGYRVNGASERLLAIGNVRDDFSPDQNLSRSQLIQWQALNANIQGSASNYSFSANDLVTVPSGACFVVSYPTLFGYGSAYPANATITYTNSASLVGNVYVQYSGERPTFRLVAIKSLSEYSSDGQFSTYSVFKPSIADDTLSPSGVSDSGHTILEPSGSLPSGGGNAGQPPVDEDAGFLVTISNFLNDIKTLLSTGSHAVVELVTYGASFMSAIASMYNWLPATLTTLIITAFSVVLVIGVIKLLWK